MVCLPLFFFLYLAAWTQVSSEHTSGHQYMQRGLQKKPTIFGLRNRKVDSQSSETVGRFSILKNSSTLLSPNVQIIIAQWWQYSVKDENKFGGGAGRVQSLNIWGRWTFFFNWSQEGVVYPHSFSLLLSFHHLAPDAHADVGKLQLSRVTKNPAFWCGDRKNGTSGKWKVSERLWRKRRLAL